MAHSLAAVRRGHEGLAAVARAVPAWVWLAGLVVASIAFRYALARRTVAPWIMADEIIYSELAKSIAEGGGFAIREQPVGLAFGAVYPLLISPAYALFDAVPDAYAAAKALNAIVMSLAAIPAYLLARRMLSVPLALVAALLTLSLPGLLYTGTLMTENAFLPIFLFAVLALVAALERPTLARSLLLLAAVAVAFLTRAQAIVFLPAIAAAPILLVAFRGTGLRGLGPYRTLYATLAAGGLSVIAAEAAFGRSPQAALGAYRSASDGDYSLVEASRWLVYHLGGLDLAAGVVPLLALACLAGTARRLRAPDQAFLAATLAVSAFLVVQVAVFASRHALRIEERNFFYLVPLFLIALLVWIDRGTPRPLRVALPAALAAAALPALIPYERLIDVPAVSDTFALLPWWTVHHWGVPLDSIWIAVLLAAAVLAAVFLAVPARYGLLLPGVVLAIFTVSLQPVESRIRTASLGSLFQSMGRLDRDWVDRALPPGERAAVVWSGRVDRMVVNGNEFFSRGLGPVYHLRQPTPGGLHETPLAVDRQDGLLRDPGGNAVEARYALADDAVALAGEPQERDVKRGVALYDVGGPLRTTMLVEGLYDDEWSGPELTYTRFRCRGGRLVVRLDSDPNLFETAQRITATIAGKVVSQRTVSPTGSRTMIVALRGGCRVRFSVSPTAIPGPGDRRRLGVHFRSFDYRPAP